MCPVNQQKEVIESDKTRIQNFSFNTDDSAGIFELFVKGHRFSMTVVRT